MNINDKVEIWNGSSKAGDGHIIDFPEVGMVTVSAPDASMIVKRSSLKKVDDGWKLVMPGTDGPDK